VASGRKVMVSIACVIQTSVVAVKCLHDCGVGFPHSCIAEIRNNNGSGRTKAMSATHVTQGLRHITGNSSQRGFKRKVRGSVCSRRCMSKRFLRGDLLFSASHA